MDCFGWLHLQQICSKTSRIGCSANRARRPMPAMSDRPARRSALDRYLSTIARASAPAISVKFRRSLLPASCSTGSASQATRSMKHVLIIYTICLYVNID